MPSARWLSSLALLLSTFACTRAPEVREPEPAEPTKPGPSLAAQPSNQHVFSYGDQSIYVYADPSLRGEVQRVFAVLDAMAAESFEIRDGSLLPIGWTTLRFEVGTDRITLLEPDYDGDPEAAWRPDISVSLSTLARQRAVLDLIDVEGEAINFDQHVLLVVGALERDDVFMMRVDSPGGRMTGWRLVPHDGIGEDDEVDSIPVHAILRARPALLDAMLLPAGYMAVYVGDRITQVIDEHDVVVWDAAVEGVPEGLGGSEDFERSGTKAGDPGLLEPLGD